MSKMWATCYQNGLSELFTNCSNISSHNGSKKRKSVFHLVAERHSFDDSETGDTKSPAIGGLLPMYSTITLLF